MVICLALAALAVGDMTYDAYQYSQENSNATQADYYASFIILITVLYSLALMVFAKRRGLITSGVQFMFWLLLAVFGAVTYRSYFMKLNEPGINIKHVSFTIYVIYYPLVIAQLVLHGLADASPKYKEIEYNVEKPCPEGNSSFLSRVVFSWFDKMAYYGYRHPLREKDLWALNYEDTSNHIVEVFEEYWEREVQKAAKANSKLRGRASFSAKSDSVNISTPPTNLKRPNVLVALFKAFGGPFIGGAILKLISDVMIFLSPIFLNMLIDFITNNEEMWKGYLYAVGMLICSEIQSLLLGQYFKYMFVVGMRIRTATVAAIYRKALVLSNSAKKTSTVGEIVNLMSVDAQRFLDLIPYINMIWSAPLQIIMAMYLLWVTLGPAMFTGLLIMVLLIPINGVVANITKKLQIKQMTRKDDRVKMMNEILNGIKVLKLYAWEESFGKQISDIRETELKVLRGIANLGAVTSFIWTSAPFLVSVGSFATYVLMDSNNVLDSKKSFVALSLFHLLRFPLSLLPMIIMFSVQASVSLDRLNKYLANDELDPKGISHDASEIDQIVVENGTFAWSAQDAPILKNINLKIPTGKLVAVVGTVGAGKSSLTSAMLGEMDKLDGRVNTKGSIAYASQLAWIQNATVRDNILFGMTYNEVKYNKVIDACALRPDLDILPGGDLTEIGEKGINLSGGQKQRVSVARAAYSNRDIIILDDPLSAVDSHVGRHMFDKVIGPAGILKGKTRVLVTHGITYLPQTDFIVVMNHGQISEIGTYKELLDKKGAFADFLVTYLNNEEELDEVEAGDLEEMKGEILSKIGSQELERRFSRQLSRTRSITSEHGSNKSLSHSSLRRLNSIDKPGRRNSRAASLLEEARQKDKAGTKLVNTESVESGQVDYKVYLYYLKAFGVWAGLSTFFGYVISQAFSVACNTWLSNWSMDPDLMEPNPDEHTRNVYLGIYGLLGMLQVIFIFLGALTMAYGTIRSSRSLHYDMLSNILKSPMSFFDTTPVGRIVNRFSKDVDVVDNTLPMTMRSWLMCFLQVISTIVVISMGTPIFLAICVPVAVIYYFIQVIYISSSRQLRRMESVTRSPIYTHFSETITGAPTIRAYGKQVDFINESQNRVDTNQICYYPSVISMRWLGVRLEFIGNLIVFASALLCVIGRGDLDPGTTGLSLSYSLSVTATLNWLVRMSGDLESNIVAVERLKEYALTPTEAPWELPEKKPKAGWPEEGKVEFVNYATRYRQGLDLVLRGISCAVKSGERVGIVGRTGAGKSSLTLSLFRIIESTQGSIIIDGVDVSKIGLHDLRSRITIIPQDPVLFSGTLRINLDPFKTHTDEELWKALEHSHLKDFASGLPDGLEHPITEGGENISVGQRQLVCLARALLRKTKILVLDEATAAVDLETDDLIQATIRQEFTDCTILTIAHRLNTIMDSNRILVLDKGLVAEYDSPEHLLANKNTIFYGMAKNAGLVQ